MLRIVNHCRVVVAWILAVGGGALCHAEDRVKIDVTLNGKPLNFIFDTGTGRDLLFRSTALRLGLKLNEPPGNPASRPAAVVALTDPIQLSFMGITQTMKLAVIDDPPAGVAPDFDGLLGWSGLRGNLMRFTGPKPRLEMGGRELPSDIANWQKLRIRRASVLLLEVPLEDGATGVVLVDTGDPAGLALSEDRWNQWKIRHSESPSTIYASSAANTGLVIVNSETWASDLSLGSLRLADVPVQKISTTGIKDQIATLGLYGLRRIDLIVDGANDTAYVSPVSWPALPYPHNRLGAAFAPADPQSDTLIAHVAKGSPADLAGVRDGDQLTKIDDVDVTKWRTDRTVLPLSRFFERPAGTKLRLTLQRDGAQRVFDVTLKDILSPTNASATQPISP